MKLTDITVGQAVTVTRGYSRRAAVVTDIHDGKVGVSFTDLTPEITKSIHPNHRSGLFGCTVRPNALESR